MQLSASNYLKSLLDFQHSLIIRRRHIMWTEEVDLKPSINHVTIQMNHRNRAQISPDPPHANAKCVGRKTVQTSPPLRLFYHFRSATGKTLANRNEAFSISFVPIG